MFDIGFSELIVIGLVALVVIGPERLPKVARTVGAYMGRLQRYVNDVKADINREIELDELRKFKTEIETAAHDVENTIRSEIHKTESELNQAARQAAGEEAAPAGPALPPEPSGAESATTAPGPISTAGSDAPVPAAPRPSTEPTEIPPPRQAA